MSHEWQHCTILADMNEQQGLLGTTWFMTLIGITHHDTTCHNKGKFMSCMQRGQFVKHSFATQVPQQSKQHAPSHDLI